MCSNHNTDFIEQVARAIYMTHWREPSPPWENTSEEVRTWVTQQAESAIVTVHQTITDLFSC